MRSVTLVEALRDCPQGMEAASGFCCRHAGRHFRCKAVLERTAVLVADGEEPILRRHELVMVRPGSLTWTRPTQPGERLWTRYETAAVREGRAEMNGLMHRVAFEQAEVHGRVPGGGRLPRGVPR